MNSTMGYRDLLSMAEKLNSRQSENDRKRDKDKKVDPKQVKLKVGVQKFLAKKEEEERKRKAEALLKKQKLLEMRNQDRKATSRVRKMLNMTKSANKSCIADAQESFSDSCNAQASEIQPDEDDYGYTSTFAAEMHKKMLEKYQANPKKPLLPGKEKVHVEVPKSQKLANNAPTSSTSKSNNPLKTPLSDNDHPKVLKKVIEKPKKQVVPPPAFLDLLRLAEEKSKEPVVIKKPLKELSDGPEFEFGRPMTAKEKAKYQTDISMKQRVQAAFAGGKVPPHNKELPSKTVNNGSANKSANNISSNSKLKDALVKKPSTLKAPEVPPSRGPPPSQIKTDKRAFANPNPNSFPTSSKSLSSGKVVADKNPQYNVQNTIQSPSSNGNRPGLSQPKNNGSYSDAPTKKDYRDREPSYSNGPRYAPYSENQSHPKPKSKQSVDNNISQKPRPPQQRHPVQQSKQSDPRYRGDARRREEIQPPRRKENKPWKGRAAVIHSDDEYDSEMDDFIDDTDVPGEDISSVIGQIFGYNKRKYADEDSDDECMESSVVQQWQEEQRSLRIGIKEDAEELRREEEEKKMKAMMMKKRARQK